MKMKESILVNLQDIIQDSKISGLASLEDIKTGFSGEPLLTGADSTNSRALVYQFFQYSDYLFEAAKSFEGQIVADLGAGRRIDGYILANICGARAYMAVDHKCIQELYACFNDTRLLRGDDELNKFIRNMSGFLARTGLRHGDLTQRIQQTVYAYFSECPHHIPVVLVAEDILTFLRRIPARSISVLTSGIDCMIVNDKKYVVCVESEIARVIDPKGAYISLMSRFEPKKLIKDESKSDCWFKKFLSGAD